MTETKEHRTTDAVAVKPQTAADMLDCTRAHVYKLIGDGTLRRFKIGRSARIPIADIHALIDCDNTTNGAA